MKVNREQFLSVIRRVAPLAKSRTTMLVLSTIKIQALNGRFHAMGCDLDSFMESICDCDGNLMACCVSPGPLLALASHGPETIELEVDQSRLKVASGSKASLSVVSPDEFAKFPTENFEDVGVNCLDLSDAIEAVSWAADPKSAKGLIYQSVFVHLDAKKQQIVSASLDGRRLGFWSKGSIVPEATIFIHSHQAALVIEALHGINPVLKTNPDGWIEMLSENLCVAVKQVPAFEFPLKPLLQSKEQSKPCGRFNRESIMCELETMQTIGQNLNGFVYGNATFNGSLSLDYVSNVNEFHSVVPADASAKQHESQRGGDEVGREPNVSAGAKPKRGAPMTAPNPTMTITFDAALLHNILKNCPTSEVNLSTDERALFFESGDLTCALALVENNP